jgi:hypothetical protein
MYMNVSMWFAVLKYFPKFRKWATPVGLTIVCLALGLGSLSTSVNHLILTQGSLDTYFVLSRRMVGSPERIRVRSHHGWPGSERCNPSCCT